MTPVDFFHHLYVQFGAIVLLLAGLFFIVRKFGQMLAHDHNKNQELLENCIEEKQMCTEQLVKLTNDVRKQLVEAHKEHTEAIKNNSKVIAEVIEVIRQCRK